MEYTESNCVGGGNYYLIFLTCRTALLYRKGRGKKQSTWRIFSLKELHAATNNFNYDNKLGEGGFGSVYWGQLWDGSQVISQIVCLLSFLLIYNFLYIHNSIYSNDNF